MSTGSLTPTRAQLQAAALVEDKVEALVDPQAERTMSSRLTKGSTFRLSKKNHPSQIEKSSFETLLAPSSYDESSQDEIALPVRSAILAADKRAAAKLDAEYHARKMMYSTMAHVTIRVTVHSRVHSEDEHERRFYMLDVVESIRFLELISVIEARIGDALGNRKLFGITLVGEVSELMNGETFSLHKTCAWCSQPWDIHVGWERGPLQVEQSARMARFLFDMYDVNGNGRIEHLELLRLHRDLRLDELDCSEQLIERFVDVELARLARLPGGHGDDEGGVSLPHFVHYVGEMVPWMRQELLGKTNIRNLHGLIAERATEAVFPPMLVPGVADLGNGRGRGSRLNMGKLGLQVEIPHGALVGSTTLREEQNPAASSHCKIALKTFAPSSVSYLLEGMNDAQDQSSQPFVHYQSEIVQIVYPAHDDGVGPFPNPSASRVPFEKPLTLIIPHCFEPASAGSTCVVLGAPLGSEKWERVDLRDASAVERAASTGRAACHFEADRVHIEVPYSGHFCVMSDPSLDEVTAVRLHLFAREQVLRDTPATLRLHACPTLPTIEHELELMENSEWGMSDRVALSKVLYLWRGARLEFTYLEQVRTITWHGIRTKCELTIPPSRMDGSARAQAKSIATDKEGNLVLNDEIMIRIVEGEGKRGSNVPMVAKRAGILLSGYQLAMCVRLQDITARLPQPELIVTERTAEHFSVQWMGGNGSGAGTGAGLGSCEVTHYALELAPSKPDGTYMQWDVLWIGAGHASPDFAARVAKRLGNDKEQNSKGLDVAKSDTFTYVLEVDPNLSGKLRLRSWAQKDMRPSPYSKEILLPRFMGKGGGAGAAEKKMVRLERRKYFEALLQHVTDGGRPALDRIGNGPSLGVWGGDAPPSPPPLTAKEKAAGVLRPAIPFDVPRLPPRTPGLQEAGATLARLYRALGLVGGGGGLLCGLRIDSILHAVVGTPTSNGKASPSRTVATLRQPMMALCEVFYQDILRPMLDLVVVLKDEWRVVDEKLCGIIAQIAAHQKRYYACEQHLITIVQSFLEIGEMMRQCQEGHVLARHLTLKDYSKSLKCTLQEELALRICNVLWRLSTDLMMMLVSVQKPLSVLQLRAGTFIANAASAAFKRRKMRRVWTRAYMSVRVHLPGQLSGAASRRALEDLMRSDAFKAMAKQEAQIKAESAAAEKAMLETADARWGAELARRPAAVRPNSPSFDMKMVQHEAEECAKRSAAADLEASTQAEAKNAADAAVDEARRHEVVQRAAAFASRHQLAHRWELWHAVYMNQCHHQRLFKLVGSHFTCTTLIACFAHWRSDWLQRIRAERVAAEAAEDKAMAERAAAKQAVAKATERQRRQVLMGLYRMHTPSQFPAAGPNAARTARLVAHLEAKLAVAHAGVGASLLLRRQTPDWVSADLDHRDWVHLDHLGRVQPIMRHRIAPRLHCPSPPSLAIAIGPPSLYTDYERHVQLGIDRGDKIHGSTTTKAPPQAAASSAPVVSSMSASPRERPVTARPGGFVFPSPPTRNWHTLSARPYSRYKPKDEVLYATQARARQEALARRKKEVARAHQEKALRARRAIIVAEYFLPRERAAIS